MNSHKEFLFEFPAFGSEWTFERILAGLNALMGVYRKDSLPPSVTCDIRGIATDVHVQSLTWPGSNGKEVISLSRTFNGVGQVSKPLIVFVAFNRPDLAEVVKSWRDNVKPKN